ncbi:MAG: hypothetical protein SGBAC_002139 [Bacillariaceae sp.]
MEIRTSTFRHKMGSNSLVTLGASSLSVESYPRRSIPSRIKDKFAEKWQSNRRVEIVQDLGELQRIVNDEQQGIVAVMFYSPMCKACKAVKPLYNKLAKKYQDVKFISVPMTPENSKHLKSMNVNQFPFGHIYKPSEGLVESAGLLRKMIPNFEKSLQEFRSRNPEAQGVGDADI